MKTGVCGVRLYGEVWGWNGNYCVMMDVVFL